MSIYQSIYDIINQYIFGMSIVSGSYQDLVAIFLSSVACIFFFALPLVIVWRIIRVFL